MVYDGAGCQRSQFLICWDYPGQGICIPCLLLSHLFTPIRVLPGQVRSASQPHLKSLEPQA